MMCRRRGERPIVLLIGRTNGGQRTDDWGSTSLDAPLAGGCPSCLRRAIASCLLDSRHVVELSLALASQRRYPSSGGTPRGHGGRRSHPPSRGEGETGQNPVSPFLPVSGGRASGSWLTRARAVRLCPCRVPAAGLGVGHPQGYCGHQNYWIDAATPAFRMPLRSWATRQAAKSAGRAGEGSAKCHSVYRPHVALQFPGTPCPSSERQIRCVSRSPRGEGIPARDAAEPKKERRWARDTEQRVTRATSKCRSRRFPMKGITYNKFYFTKGERT